MGDKITGILVVTVGIAIFGGTFQYGYNIAVVNAPAKIIQSYFFELDTVTNNGTTTHDPNGNNLVTVQALGKKVPVANYSTEKSTAVHPHTYTQQNVVQSEEISELSDYQLFLWSFTVSIFTVGGMIGSLLVGTFVKKFGRKGTLLVMNSLSIVGGILMGSSKAANSIILIIIARFLLGIYSGLATGVVPMFIGEVAPKKIRGAIVALNQLLITVGILTSQILGLTEVLGTPELWPVLLAVTAVPSIIELCVLPFAPESPRCLLIDRKNEEEARKALVRLRGTDDVDKEMDEMRSEAAAESSSSQISVLELLRDKSQRWQTISVGVLNVGQQLCGINAIFFYLNSIFDSAGVPPEMQNYASVAVGTVNVIMTVVSVAVIEWAGRKILLGGGFAWLSVWCVIMTIALSLQDQVSWMPYLSIASVIFFIIGFAVGPGPVVWILCAELFQQSARPAAFTVGCVLNWTSNFVLALIFPFMQKFMGQYVFLFFLVIGVASSVYSFLIIPETKNKTFQEINQMFAKRNGIKNTDMELVEEQTEALTK